MGLLFNALLSICFLLPAVQSATQSALESDPKGWKNLFANKTMKDWIRGLLSVFRGAGISRGLANCSFS